MKDRQRVIIELGSRLEAASRASVAKGAMYDPGETISTDTEAAWRAIAESLVSLVEITVREEMAEVKKAIDAQS
jgi:hypothetical protein